MLPMSTKSVTILNSQIRRRHENISYRYLRLNLTGVILIVMSGKVSGYVQFSSSLDSLSLGEWVLPTVVYGMNNRIGTCMKFFIIFFSIVVTVYRYLKHTYISFELIYLLYLKCDWTWFCVSNLYRKGHLLLSGSV